MTLYGNYLKNQKNSTYHIDIQVNSIKSTLQKADFTLKKKNENLQKIEKNMHVELYRKTIAQTKNKKNIEDVVDGYIFLLKREFVEL
jgi:hypothetical protein